MTELLELAIEIKEYVNKEGRTLAVSQGKMLRDTENSFSVNLDKQTA